MEHGTETDLDLGLLGGDGDLFNVAGVLGPPLQWLSKLRCILLGESSSAQFQNLIIQLLFSNTNRLVPVQLHTPVMMFEFN